jgi:proteasome component ECM29
MPTEARDERKTIAHSTCIHVTLAEGGDLVQDVASKGLGLVFECCTVEQQNLLAGELVGSLTTDRRPAMQVNKDTKVFEEGSLGANPSG